MLLFLFKRFLAMLATFLAASVIIMIVLEVLPGNAAQTMLGPEASPEVISALERQLGIDQPVWLRYGSWIGGLVQGDIGISNAYGVSAYELIVDSLNVTFPLAFLAMFITLLLAIASGLYAASRQNHLGDVITMGVTQIGIAIPNFWMAIVLVMVFAVNLQWFPAGGFSGWSAPTGGFWKSLHALILPALALTSVQAAMLARVTRSAVLDVMREDYVRTARAKGLSRNATLFKHVLRNALIPVVTFAGLQFANLLAGTVVVENVFQLPGLGKLMLSAIDNRDTVLIRNSVMLLVGMVIVVNFCVDLVYALIDTRVKLGQFER